jgi:hypothetical protein
MKRPHIATLCAVLSIGGACSCAPALADGGVPAAPAAAGTPTLFARPGELLGRVLRFRGALSAGQAGRTVQVQRLLVDGSWAPTATAVAGPDGGFVARWRTDQLGRFTVRAVVTAADAQVAAAAAPATTQVTVYRPAKATWYGPGFYGRKTACGERMTHALLGVAHRTLPCGTPVEIFLGGRTLTVPVVDRGPYGIPGARYDLTSAAARQLGMTVTTTIGVAPQRDAQMPPPPPAPYVATGGAAFGQP